MNNKTTIFFLFMTLNMLFLGSSLRIHEGKKVAYMMKGSVSPKIYIHFYGSYYWIPNETVYYNLFKYALGDQPYNIVDQAQVDKTNQIQLSNDTYLVKGESTPNIYLVTNGQKWWIPTEDSFNLYYGFNWNKVVVKSQKQVDAIPNAPGKLY